MLSIIDIDNQENSIDVQRKYTNEVPILVLDSHKLARKIELPRVSPRLKEDLLLSWIQKNLNIFFFRYKRNTYLYRKKFEFI